MSFTITASTPSREISFSAGSMLAALEKALQLSATGKQNVQVIDRASRVHTPAALHARVFLQLDGSPR